MFKSRKSLVLGVMAVLAPLASSAQANDNGLGLAYLFGFGAANTPAIRSFVPAPPYFALHPPVYYGQRYTRPYGESPFAAWPQLQSPPGYYPRPAANHAYVQPLVMNFAPALPAAPAPELPAPPAPPATNPSPVVIQAKPIQPLVISNPYYHSNESRLVGK